LDDESSFRPGAGFVAAKPAVPPLYVAAPGCLSLTMKTDAGSFAGRTGEARRSAAGESGVWASAGSDSQTAKPASQRRPRPPACGPTARCIVLVFCALVTLRGS